MSKKEAYYKFVFPNYTNVYGYGDNNIDTPIKTLLNTCPSNAMTYDRLPGTLRQYVDQYLSIPKYFNIRIYDDDVCGDHITGKRRQTGGSSLIVSHSPEVNNEDAYHSWTKFKAHDNKIVYCSVIVSSGDFFYNWNLPEEVLEKSDLRDVIVRSRFHANWYFNNEDQIIYKNRQYGVVTKLQRDFPNEYSGFSVHFGQEKRVFNTSFFKYPGLHYVHQGTANAYIHFRDSNNNVYSTSEVYYIDGEGRRYNQSNYTEASGAVIPDYSNVQYITETVYNSNDTSKSVTVQTIPGYFTTDGDIPVTRYKYRYSSGAAIKSGNSYYVRLKDANTGVISNKPVSVYFNVEEYRELSEDLKKDFIDLEVTRRILHYGEQNYANLQSTSTRDIPKIVNPVDLSYNNGNLSQDLANFLSKDPSEGLQTYLDALHSDRSGKNTQLSYTPPQEYIDRPPMYIPYNLLRNALNNKDPYGDQETVLVMWVADSDPSSQSISKGDVASLHNLNWQQYAIPISVRCYIKDDNSGNDIVSNRRFIVEYPKKFDPSSSSTDYVSGSDTSRYGYLYRFHIRRNAEYDKSSFKEALYLPGLINYSQDYIIAYHNTSSYMHYSSGQLNIQDYLFSKHSDKFSALYVRRHYNYNNSNALQQQAYYILVKNEYYAVNRNSSLPVCFTSHDDANVVFKPSDHILMSSYENYQTRDWRPWPNDSWGINNNHFIALFSNNNHSIATEVSGSINLVNADDLRSHLRSCIDFSSGDSIDDIYLCSLGFSNACNWSRCDSLLYSTGSTADKIYPIDFLDGYIKIGNKTYSSSNSDHKFIVGFKNMFEFKYDDSYHFHYSESDHTYKLVHTVETVDGATSYTEVPDSENNCTAYIMTYTT